MKENKIEIAENRIKECEERIKYFSQKFSETQDRLYKDMIDFESEMISNIRNAIINKLLQK